MFKNSLLVSLYCVQEVGGEFFVEEVDGVSVFRRLRSGCEVDAVLQSAPPPPSDASFGYSDLPVLPPHVLNNISGGDNAEDPAASPSLLDERVEIVSQTFRGWLGLATACDVSTHQSNAAFVLTRRQAEQCSKASVPRESRPR